MKDPSSAQDVGTAQLQQDKVSTAPAPSTQQELFSWTQAWYPLAAISALKQDAPNAQQLLGMRLVVWWDKASSSWRCFEDLCPHRCASVMPRMVGI